MGRLIDADALIEEINNMPDGCNLFRWRSDKKIKAGLERIISKQPTAYDVEKVVAELEKLKQHNKELSEGAYLEDDKSFYFCAYTNFAKAIDIVKRGGAG